MNRRATSPALQGIRAAGLASLLLLAACGGGEGFGLPDKPPGTGDALAAPVLAVSAAGIKTLHLDWNPVAGATGFRVLASPGASEPFEPVIDLPGDSVRHEVEVLLPERLGARYRVGACNAKGCADSEPVGVDAALLNAAIGYFKASNPGGSFGASAALSANGRVLAIGVPGDDSAATGVDGNPDNHLASDSGAVYVFARGASGWTRQAYIKPGNTTAGDRFGEKLSLSAQGDRLAVAVPRHNGFDGAVALFERNGTTWSQVTELVPPVPNEARSLGESLALSADGNTLVVGDGGNAGWNWPPEVYVYTRGPGGWSTARETLPPAETAVPLSATYAEAVTVSDDGNTVAVAARAQNIDPATTASPGAVYVFTRSAGVWSVKQRLTASNAGNGDDFGWSLALSADGQTLAVGARSEDSPSSGVNGTEGNGLLNSGAVYMFARSGDAWSQQAYIKASHPGEFDNFGHAVALSADGNVLAVTAIDEDSADQGLGGSGADDARQNSGAAYLFRRSASTWRQTAYIKASAPDGYDRFGESVALSGDGLTLAVGAANEDSASTGIGGDAQDNNSPSSGAVYLY